jgi:Uma2 family endonuclease
MVQALAKTQPVTFDDFAQWKPEKGLYELHDGVIVEMPQPVGKHEEVKGFLSTELVFEYRRLNFPYFLPSQAFVKMNSAESAYLPDILVLNRPNLFNESLWERQSTVTQGASIPLVVEVVSTNWRVDYLTKVKDYVFAATSSGLTQDLTSAIKQSLKTAGSEGKQLAKSLAPSQSGSLKKACCVPFPQCTNDDNIKKVMMIAIITTTINKNKIRK